MPLARPASRFNGRAGGFRHRPRGRIVQPLTIGSGYRMRRFAALLPALFLLLAPTPPHAQGAAPAPPHAWLFGAWSGGLFPAPSGLTAQECLAQPTVIFARDVVMRATLTDVTYVQRVIESARLTVNGTEFRFVAGPPPTSNLLGIGAAPTVGFGCENTDVLHVVRRGENEISFPGCADYPYPLVRCPGR
jgi:hypothetical protein